MRHIAHFSRRPWLGMALIMIALLASTTQQTARAADPPLSWHDTGELSSALVSCVDATRPHTLLVSNSGTDSSLPAGTYAYNWATGERSLLTPQPFDQCGTANGLLFGHDTPIAFPLADQPALRFSLRDPQPRAIAHTPTHIARDGTLQVYAFYSKLWASSDGGLTWQERQLPPFEYAWDLAVAAADAQAIYVVGGSVAGNQATYSLYFSPDGGVTWEQRATGNALASANPAVRQVSITTFDSTTAPVDLVQLATSNGYYGRYSTVTIALSSDAGRSFRPMGDSGAYVRTQLLYTHNAILRLNQNTINNDTPHLSLTRSVDGGASWQPANLPFDPSSVSQATAGMELTQAPSAPDALFLRDDKQNFWLSTDGGASWRQPEQQNFWPQFSPYLPLSAVSTTQNHVYTLDLPDLGPSLVAPAQPTHAPGDMFFLQTDHNLSGIFKRAWEAQGGLAQFGYPTSEPLREINPEDGQIYLVQYFERNRFEYHPENAGTQYEVLLGLLGNQLTAARRAAGEAPFNRVDNTNGTAAFFPETGHTLSEPFRSYWQQHGGLSIYGYPISEPFDEVNPADGKTYTVQYFERNRFEYHPENAGTPYEVLLGLLGNQVLHEKGWQ